METVRVRALSNVLGLQRGDEVDVLPTPRVEVMIRGGHLVWLDEPTEDPIPDHDEGETDAEPPADAKGSDAKAASRAPKAKVKSDE
jgi:hypothetical protein